MELNNLSPAPGSTQSRKRVGRGTGSGLGKTSGKGHKGQKARSGGSLRPGFEGGQMPIARRVPKRGFTNFTKKVFEVVNVGDFKGKTISGTVTPETLVQLGLIKNIKRDVKLLANGDVDFALEIHVHKASAAAVAKIEKAGGKVQVL